MKLVSVRSKKALSMLAKVCLVGIYICESSYSYREKGFLISQPKHMLWLLKKNSLNETVLLSSPNICLNRWIGKETCICHPSLKA